MSSNVFICKCFQDRLQNQADAIVEFSPKIHLLDLFNQVDIGPQRSINLVEFSICYQLIELIDQVIEVLFMVYLHE